MIQVDIFPHFSFGAVAASVGAEKAVMQYITIYNVAHRQKTQK